MKKHFEELVLRTVCLDVSDRCLLFIRPLAGKVDGGVKLMDKRGS